MFDRKLFKVTPLAARGRPRDSQFILDPEQRRGEPALAPLYSTGNRGGRVKSAYEYLRKTRRAVPQDRGRDGIERK